MNCHHHHQKVESICLNQECSTHSLICSECYEETHERHPLVGLQTIKQTLRRFLAFKQQNKDLPKDQEVIYNKIQTDLFQSQESIQKQSHQLARLSEFFVSFKDQLLNLQDIGEAEVVYQLLGQIEQANEPISLQQANQTLCRLFLHLKVLMNKNSETGQTELYFQKTPISQIRTKFLLGRKADYSSVVKDKIDQQNSQFEKFFEQMGAFFSKNPQYVISLEENYEQKYAEFQKNHKQIKIEESLFAFEPFCSMAGKNQASKDQQQNGVSNKKQIFKLCHYLIFYTPLACELVLEEPLMKANDIKKLLQDELNMPIKCQFCQLLKLKSFLQVYYRMDIASRYGRLCRFTFEGQELWVHEQCLLWTNMIIIDPKFNGVDVKTIIPAVQNATNKQCRFCDLAGASLKCNNTACDIYYHFYCFKKSKLRGLQFDLKEKYRFFCEDHHGAKNYSGHSEWFLSRQRLRADVVRNGLEEEPKKKNKEYKIEIDNENGEQYDDPIPKMIRRGRKRIRY